jgi:hypothetical protein
MTNHVFIDSNIIANWIIISEAMKLKKGTADKIKLDDFHKKIQNSYILLEKIKENKYENETCQFFTSKFSLCEVYNVIGTEFKSRKLFEKNIPFRYWMSMLKKMKLKNEQFPEIDTSLKGFTSTFLNPNDLKMHPAESYKQDNVGRLLWIYNCNTHDGMLIAQAIDGNCNYFISEDEELIKNMKYNHFGIKVCHCETFLREKL